jgi:hypothetical protein|tara:strand:- start:4048 stop:4407 length:360 start_codon:yes stop_codon:yes gene_type:complete
MAQDQKVDLKKEVFSRNQYSKTIDTEFTQFGVVTVQEDLESQTTVEDFFTTYDELFYDIPAEGESNSHEYLIRTSGEYVSFDANQEEIDALRNEIANIREENLELQQENANLILSSSTL